MSDQNKSDWLAEHLLGWRARHGYWMNKNNGYAFNYNMAEDLATPQWQPHEKIEQCFAYIIPTMEKIGFNCELELYRGIMPRAKFFVTGARAGDIHGRHFADADTPAAAIVEACYLALQKEKL